MRKKLLLLSAFLLGTLTIHAQITDITSDYLTNPSFETDDAVSNLTDNNKHDWGSPTGWTLTTKATGNAQWGVANSSSTIQGIKTSFSPSDGEKYYYIRCNWNENVPFTLSQDAKLPAGTYRISMKYATYSTAVSNAPTGIYTFKATDGTTTQTQTYTATTPTSAWETASLIVAKTTDENTALTISASMTQTNPNSGRHVALLVDDVTIESVDVDLTSYTKVSDYLIGTFEDCTAASASVSGSNTAATTGATNGEWTYSTSAMWSCSGVVAYGQTGVTVASVSAPSADNAGSTGNALGVSVGWSGTELWKQTNAVTLPAGTYVLKYSAYNNNSGNGSMLSRVGFVATAGTEYLADKSTYTDASWETDYVTFALGEATEGNFQVGGQALNSGSGYNAKVFFDNLELYYIETVDLTSYKEAYEAALAAAQAAIESEDYANVTGEEKTALQSAIDAGVTEETALAYTAATTALTTATTTFTEAKSSYDSYAAQKAVAESLGVDLTSVETPNTASAAETAVNTIAQAVETSVSETYTIDATTYASVGGFGDWTFSSTTGESYGTNGSDPEESTEHWSGVAGITYYEQSTYSWSATSFTDTYTQTVTLPAGSYVLKFAARAMTDVTLTASATVGETAQSTTTINSKGSTGYGIETDGSVNFSSEGTYARDGAGYGWEWYYLPVALTEESSVTFTMTATTSTNHQWFSLCDMSLLTTSDNSNYVAAKVTITAGGNNADNTAYYATCQTSTAVDLDKCEFEAYAVNVTDGVISYTKAEGTVPAGTCLLICDDSYGEYEAVLGVSADAKELDTDLQPAGDDEKGDGSTKYILFNGTEGLGWYLCDADASINEGVCYLVIEGTSAAKFIGINADATGISSLTNSKAQAGVRYNVSGQRVGTDYKGIVIENGKKYLVK